MRRYIRSRTGLQQRAKERGCHNPIAHHKGGEGKSRRLYHWLELPKRMRRGHHREKLSARFRTIVLAFVPARCKD